MVAYCTRVAQYGSNFPLLMSWLYWQRFPLPFSSIPPFQAPHVPPLHPLFELKGREIPVGLVKAWPSNALCAFEVKNDKLRTKLIIKWTDNLGH